MVGIKSVAITVDSNEFLYNYWDHLKLSIWSVSTILPEYDLVDPFHGL